MLPALAREARARGRAPDRRMSGPPLMHGTGCWLGMMVPQLLGGTAVSARAALARPRRALVGRRARARQPPWSSSATPSRSRCCARSTRPSAAGEPSTRLRSDDGLVGRRCSRRGEAGAARPHPGARDRRRARLDRGRHGLSRSTTQGPAPRPRSSSSDPDDQGLHRGRPRGRSPAPARSAWSRTAAWCRSATTRTPRSRRARSAMIDGVRYSFPGDMATVEADGTHHAPRPRLATASTPAARRSSPRRSRRR